jgi:hypothetical protein
VDKPGMEYGVDFMHILCTSKQRCCTA